MKIDLPLSTQLGWKVVTAEIVDVAPHLAGVLTFAIHKQSRLTRIVPNGYQISNLETGRSLGWADAPSRAECLKNAKWYLSGKTVADAELCMATVARQEKARKR